ncbi:Fur family transcriptional regulator [Paracoccus sp. Z330]|uniref:Fur family transcriptional regulator n=1 Tax=Paracoccus onchidii TaxID=3017813 RepID=A0ABT4ZAB0_9RHOB|nr:Fur family transcriptional regulator [Paracoccus onchidii]MDB6176072.1 Fur family transcriptional regulator [Paracoccus onchidii]
MTQERTGAGAAFAPHDHQRCQADALQVAEQRLAAKKARLTPVRRRTLELLLESHRAMGAYEVLERLAAEGYGSQPPVAYRALEFLVQHGLAHRLQRLNAFAACLHPECEHAPAFLICRVCSKLAEVPAGYLQDELGELSQDNGFTIERLTVEAVGLCAGCAKAGAA